LNSFRSDSHSHSEMREPFSHSESQSLNYAIRINTFFQQPSSIYSHPSQSNPNNCRATQAGAQIKNELMQPTCELLVPPRIPTRAQTPPTSRRIRTIAISPLILTFRTRTTITVRPTLNSSRRIALAALRIRIQTS
jgi:hypothetical protein